MLLRLLIGLGLLLSSAKAFELSVEVHPQKRLWMDDVDVIVRGAEPGAQVTVTLALTDDRGQAWSSRGVFFADLEGDVVLSRDASTEGTYRGVDAHGLFWSLLPVKVGQIAEVRAEDIDPRAPRTPRLSFTGSVDTLIRAETKQEKSSVAHNVGFLAPGVHVEEVDEAGLRGQLLTPPGDDPHPVVMIITGSGGGINLRSASLLSSQGMTVFALAHFNYPGRPKELVNIPLEYFDSAIKWLVSKTGASKIGLAGLSRGGEGALLIASVYPDHIGAVVSGVPSNVVWGGCCTSAAVKQPAWTLGGQPVTASPYPFEEGKEGFEYLADSVGFRDFYMPGMVAGGDSVQSTIRVENIKAPVLLLSGAADLMWPSTIAAQKVHHRLAANGFAYPFESVVYPAAGHHVTGDVYVTIRSSEVVHPVTGTTMYLGGLPSENAKSSRDAFWRRTAFFKEHLPLTNRDQPSSD